MKPDDSTLCTWPEIPLFLRKDRERIAHERFEAILNNDEAFHLPTANSCLIESEAAHNCPRGERRPAMPTIGDLG